MVSIENITYSYGRTSKNVLEDISFKIEPGECIAVLGNNGAGKSTLLKCIDRICPAGKGTVVVNGKDVFQMNGRQMACHIAYVAQNAAAVNMTVFDTVLLGRRPYIKWDVSEKDQKIVNEILSQMKLEDYALRTVSELSGGEAQKVMLARALAQQPQFLLLDEPTSNLDPRNQHEVLQVVRKIAKEHHICVAIIIHDLNLAVRYCDRFLFLKDSHVYAYGGREVMTSEVIEAVYGMQVQIIQHEQIPIIIPFPEVNSESGSQSVFAVKNEERKAQGRLQGAGRKKILFG
ncbi:MAG: ABC transporter ATP-binding protein [Lachnospiraceae bacterium]|nr:ABC transporter ATP-binding protein [Lachnospiraceae bacterium]